MWTLEENEKDFWVPFKDYDPSELNQCTELHLCFDFAGSSIKFTLKTYFDLTEKEKIQENSLWKLLQTKCLLSPRSLNCNGPVDIFQMFFCFFFAHLFLTIDVWLHTFRSVFLNFFRTLFFILFFIFLLFTDQKQFFESQTVWVAQLPKCGTETLEMRVQFPQRMISYFQSGSLGLDPSRYFLSILKITSNN